MSPRDRDAAQEYAAAQEAWRSFCHHRPQLEVAPLVVVLVHALAEPPFGEGSSTGDLFADVMSGLRVLVESWRAAATRSGGEMAMVDLGELYAFERRLHVMSELRRREVLVSELVGDRPDRGAGGAS